MEDVHSESAVLSGAKRQIGGLQDIAAASASSPKTDKGTETRRRAVFAYVRRRNFYWRIWKEDEIFFE